MVKQKSQDQRPLSKIFLGGMILLGRSNSFLIESFLDLSKYQPFLLFKRSKGDGGGCTTDYPNATAIFTVCIVLHRALPCAVTIHKTLTDKQLNGYKAL